MTLDEAIAELRELNEEVPKPMRLPTEAEVAKAESTIGLKFHPDYRKFLLEASDVVYGTTEPATITLPKSHTHLPTMCEEAWELGVPDDAVPICEDNGDYFCMDPKGKIFFFSMDGASDETWPDLATWIEQVWIGESE